MIVVTGAAGFISSCLVSELNKNGYQNIVVVDDFSKTEKATNLEGKTIVAKVSRGEFFEWAKDFVGEIEFIFHLGARTDTTEFNQAIFDELNLNYSKKMWQLCADNNIPLVYASSAATYGLGELGYKDDHSIVDKLKPLNPYGESKNDFDIWALKQDKQPPFWAGLKFFNVYGPNEYHKGRMASVILHAFRQITETGKMKLFASHNPDYKDGEQLRDFVYVKDVVSVCMYLMDKRPANGLYNLGTGEARTFLDLTKATFKAMGKEADISFVPTPEDIRDKYQYFTEADMSKLVSSGYSKKFYTLEEGVNDYVQHYLMSDSYM
ncbi:ADP-glyceromanno-heptose 6-epimerase [Paracrocinitomix mangrovi]|uniref:ADP-glyceromanno-heptose 6-epimerase n=1 Tax=Paracrocinitomix mangrovi TaxID=2862509 RepID=UPI001C8D5137|nr:ADP-glyceromanno-heptose 6-epimerase [Paracrocinitomix mangrovi]UKN01132.1 ADP-glyceromanno-heptose 6-epimerase [Paracrocinitomix mangrovi]